MQISTAGDRTFLSYGCSKQSPYLYRRYGIDSPAQTFLLEQGSRRTAIVPPYEVDYYSRYAAVDKVISVTSLPGYSPGYGLEAVIGWLKKRAGRFTVPAEFPAWLFTRLREAFLDVTVSDSYFARALLRKDSVAIRSIRHNCRIVTDCFSFIADILTQADVRRGLLYYEKAQLTNRILLRLINEFMALSGIVCDIPVIACGKYTYYPHSMVEQRLASGQPILVDLGCRDIFSGYYSDVSRTFWKGRPRKPGFLNLYHKLPGIERALIERLAVGEKIGDVYEAAEKLLGRQGVRLELSRPARRGELVCHHALGHGVGRRIHELPSFTRGVPVSLEAGMVFALEIGGYIKGGGGVRLENTYLVKRKEIVNLSEGSMRCELE